MLAGARREKKRAQLNEKLASAGEQLAAELGQGARPGGVAHQDALRVAACPQPTCDLAADEAGGAGQEDLHVAERTRAVTSP